MQANSFSHSLHGGLQLKKVDRHRTSLRDTLHVGHRRHCKAGAIQKVAVTPGRSLQACATPSARNLYRGFWEVFELQVRNSMFRT